MVLARWLGLKTIAWGQGIGPLNQGLSRRLGRFALQRCTAISVRDSGSAAWLDQWKLLVCKLPTRSGHWMREPVKGLVGIAGHQRVRSCLRPHPKLTGIALRPVRSGSGGFPNGDERLHSAGALPAD